MHISDGVLPIYISLGGYVASGVITTLCARRTSADALPKLAVMTSAFFVASLVHVPFGPTSVHLLLPGLTGAFLGPAAFISIALALLLQSLLFQFGGLTALGVNTLMVGVPALMCGWLFHHFKGTSPQTQALAGGLVAALGTLLVALLLALFLTSAGEDFHGVAKMALLAHLPVVVIEGVITAFTIGFMARVKPVMLQPPATPAAGPLHG